MSASWAEARKLEEIDWDRWEAVDRATLLFVVDDGRVLLIRKKRGLGAGKINGPGGKLEDGETAHEAALRETFEEIRVRPRRVGHRGELRFQFVDGYSIHVEVFRAEEYRGQPRETDEATPMWVPRERIPYEQMWADDRLWLPLLLEDEHFTGRFIFDDDTMLDHEVRTLSTAARARTPGGSASRRPP